jgi:hypothetical protein
MLRRFVPISRKHILLIVGGLVVVILLSLAQDLPLLLKGRLHFTQSNLKTIFFRNAQGSTEFKRTFGTEIQMRFVGASIHN